MHAGFDGDYKSTAPAMKEVLGYVLGRFGLPSLVAQGEEGSVRRAVHAHLLEGRGPVTEPPPPPPPPPDPYPPIRPMPHLWR